MTKRPKPKFERLTISCLRGGEIQYATKYNARDAAREATKRAKDGWSCKILGGAGKRSTTFMSCEPSARRKYWSDPKPKAHAICTMTPAFKKRIRGR